MHVGNLSQVLKIAYVFPNLQLKSHLMQFTSITSSLLNCGYAKHFNFYLWCLQPYFCVFEKGYSLLLASPPMQVQIISDCSCKLHFYSPGFPQLIHTLETEYTL